MSKIRIVVKEKSTARSKLPVSWVETTKGKKINVAPRKCDRCSKGIWDGHVFLATDSTYCTTCFDECCKETTLEHMFSAEVQYYTAWTELDFDREIYDVVYENA